MIMEPALKSALRTGWPDGAEMTVGILATRCPYQGAGSAGGGPAMGDTTLFTNGLFLDVDAVTYREGDLRADDGLVTGIGPGLSAPADARRVDLGGAYVLPGLIDCHVHITASTAD